MSINKEKIQRRQFMAKFLKLAGVSAGIVGLSSCSTIDEFLFADPNNIADQVIVVGGGLSGLHMAYLLKLNKIEFRLFEGSNRFGGRIRSANNYDYGASIFSSGHRRLQQLLKELSLKPEVLDFSLRSSSGEKLNQFLAGGMEALVGRMVERTAGLMPYRNLRLQWKLLAIRKVDSVFELQFQTPGGGRRVFSSSRVVLAIPPSQWTSVSGLLDLEEMRSARTWLTTATSENLVRLVWPSLAGGAATTGGAAAGATSGSAITRTVLKRTRGVSWAEMDFRVEAYDPKAQKQKVEIQKLVEIARRRLGMPVTNASYAALNKGGTEHFFDWRDVQLIQGAYFKNPEAWPEKLVGTKFFRVIGDFTSIPFSNSMEGALDSAALAFSGLSLV